MDKKLMLKGLEVLEEKLNEEFDWALRLENFELADFISEELNRVFEKVKEVKMA